MKRRVLTIMLAALLAVAGTVGVLAYVRQANTRAVAGLRTENVMIATGAIPSGTTVGDALSEGLLASQKLPVSSVPSDAVLTISSSSPLNQLVTSYALQPGELLLRPALVSAAAVTGALAIPAGDVAVTIQVCLQADVAGFVQQGSEVAVFDTYSNRPLAWEEACEQTRPAQIPSLVFTRIVLIKAKVLSVSASLSNGSSTSSGTSALADGPSSNSASTDVVMVTLALTQNDAERLITIAQSGLPWLALLGVNSKTYYDPVNQPPLFRSSPGP